MIDLEPYRDKFVALASQYVGEYLSKRDLPSGETGIPNVVKIRKSGITLPYPYVVVDYLGREKQNGWLTHRRITDDLATEYETKYDLMFSYTIYGGDAVEIAEALEGYFRHDEVLDSFRSEGLGAVVNTTDPVPVSFQEGERFVNTASFNIILSASDISTVTDSGVITRVDLTGELKRSEDDPDPLPIRIIEPPPYSGPGSQELVAGDMTQGYFGEVTAAELFYGDELGALVGLTGSANISAGWLKFALDDKILFIAKMTFQRAISWGAIYAAGCVYGTDDNGFDPTGTPTNQLKIVTKGSDQFVVRLPKGADTNPATGSIGSDDPSGVWNSEWNRLMYKVHVDVPESQVGDNWASFTSLELGMDNTQNGKNSWCQETYNANRVTRGGAGVSLASQVPPDQVSSPYGWRPVLELIQ